MSMPSMAVADPARPTDRWEYNALFVATFPVFVLGAALRRLGRRDDGRTRGSIVSDARARAGAVLPFAFMG